jgi:thiamine transport system ATP-binding protein
MVMRAGRVVQTATPGALWDAPADEWVARFLGFGPAVEIDVRDGAACTPWGVLPVGGADGRACVVLRPGAVRGSERGESAGAAVSGTVVRRTFRGDHVVLDVAVEGAPPVGVRAGVDDVTAVGSRIRVAIDHHRALVYRS